jgi:ATP-binding protein involved in chromosome partitioning
MDGRDALIEAIRAAVSKVKDPEFGKSIAERELIDEIRVDGSTAYITYHLTVAFCPDPFAVHIGKEIRKQALSVPGIEKVELTVKGHINAAKINKALQQ